MFERFDEGARRSVALAQHEARALGHDYIGTEHVLLGMLAEGKSVAAAALTEVGVSADAARAEVGQVVGRGRHTDADSRRPFTPRAKKLLELSLREALQVDDRFIGTEHLLLGLLREGQGVAMQVLSRFDVAADRLRSTVLRLREQREPPPIPESRRDSTEAMLRQILDQQEMILGALDRLTNPPPPENV